MSELNESLSLGRSDIIGALGLTFWRLQIKQFWIIDLASFFPLVIKNDKICSLPVCNFSNVSLTKLIWISYVFHLEWLDVWSQMVVQHGVSVPKLW